MTWNIQDTLLLSHIQRFLIILAMNRSVHFFSLKSCNLQMSEWNE